MANPFGRALLDHYRGDRTVPLYQRDGETVRTHPIEDFYFGKFETGIVSEWTETWLEGPLLDIGAGAGRDALYFQERFETVAIEVCEPLVTLLTERGVSDPRIGNMFALPEQFESDRFQSVLARGTQVGLVKSRQGLVTFLEDLATVTTPDATAVLDFYDPTFGDAVDMLGFRYDPTPGLAFRVFHFEYEDEVGETLLFRLFSPDRLREAVSETSWSVIEVHRPHDAYYYLTTLQKE